MDYQTELLYIAEFTQMVAAQKKILKTTVLDESEQTSDDKDAFKEIKQAFSGDKKTFIIKVKEEVRAKS